MSVTSNANTTLVHLLRHGEVYNPQGILYGRRAGFELSERGRRMAERVGESLADRDVSHLVSSPLERARQTAAPLARRRDLDITTDERVIESENVFQGERFSARRSVMLNPKSWQYLWNPLRPSWGEPYREVIDRMMAAIHDARRAAAGSEAVVVSHQLPIWVTRMHLEGRKVYAHDPRKRHCTLCSLTTLWFEGDHLARVTYSEPAGDLIPVQDRGAPFSAGGAPDENKPPGSAT